MTPTLQLIEDHPVLVLGGFIVSMWVSLALVVVISVEFALVRRLREIKTMFRSALNVAESYATEVMGLRRERKEDSAAITGLLEVQGHQGQAIEDHRKRIEKLEGWWKMIRPTGDPPP